MAKKIVSTLIDDIDGGEATETIQFGIDGVMYTIDLSEENAATLRDVFREWTNAATKMKRTGPGRKQAPRNTNVDNDAIREWARSEGYAVSDRGRIKQEIIDAYNSRSISTEAAEEEEGNFTEEEILGA